MQTTEFERFKNEFEQADVDKKIEMYVSVDGLSQSQYKELLRLYPVSEIPRLEQAL